MNMNDAPSDDISELRLLHEFRENRDFSDIPIVLTRNRPWTRKVEEEVRKLSHSIRLAEASSPEALLDRTAYFLHRPAMDLTAEQRNVLERLHQTDSFLKGKKILVVDDDIRNIFAVTSLLERHDLKVLSAENGKDAIDTLRKNPDIDIVLMDIMMPEMDGYETMQQIRKIPEYKSLSIIALTAKAMKEDRNKCIEAGASDFIAKPVDTEGLLSCLRVWLYH